MKTVLERLIQEYPGVLLLTAAGIAGATLSGMSVAHLVALLCLCLAIIQTLNGDP